MSLISIMFFALLMSAFIITLNLTPIFSIQNEQQVLQELSRSLSLLQTNSLLLPQKNFKVGYKDFTDSIEETNLYFKKVSTLKTLSDLSPKVKKALNSIVNLQSLLVQDISTLQDFILQLDRSVIKMFGFESEYQFRLLLTDSYMQGKGFRDDLIALSASYDEKSYPLSFSLISIIEILNEQKLIIDKEVNKAIIGSLVLAAIITALITVIAVVSAIIISRKINLSIIAIDQSVNILQKGDLTEEITAISHDEIGNLAKNLSRFKQTLEESISKIRDSAQSSKSTREVLLTSTEETSAATIQMQHNVESIIKQIEILDKSIIHSEKAIHSISEKIQDNTESIQAQNQSVNESNQEVVEMIVSIRDIAEITSKTSQDNEQLIEMTYHSGENLKKTVQDIDSLNNGINDIKKTTDIIQDIASQTSLLSMNASIEAAHAGEKGKGFSVVAAEIKKLSEASTKSSKEISETLAEMVKKIQSANKMGKETFRTYELLKIQVENLAEAFNVIQNSIIKVESGSSHIMHSLEALQTNSEMVLNNNVKINRDSEIVQNSVTDVGSVSSQVTLGIREINIGLVEIKKSMQYLMQLSQKVELIGNELDESVSYFQIT